jgi:hydroxyacylglutathione hydrolase
LSDLQAVHFWQWMILMNYSRLPVTPFQQNCTIFWCDVTRKAVLIDPGGEAQRIIAAVASLEVEVEKILLTHGHLDHVGAAPQVAQHYQVPIWGPQEEDRFWLDALPQQGEVFGIAKIAAFLPDRWLAEGDRIEFGQEVLEVLHCPGHTPGHVVYFNRAAKLAQVGDVLFKGGMGRTDFPRGDYATLRHSIKMRLFPLGDDIAFISGHGAMSSFGEEKKFF